MDVQERLTAAEGEDKYYANDTQLQNCCECARDVYVADEGALRKAFAPATIQQWTTVEYSDGQRRYSAGILQPGDAAPDFPVRIAKPADATISSDTEQLVETSLLSFRKPDRCLVLDFGSFS